MPRKVERRYVEPEEERLNREIYTPVTVGRPPNTAPRAGSVVVTLALIRQCWQAMVQAGETLEAGPARKAILDALGALHTRIGPAVDSDEPVSKRGPGRPGGDYVVRWPDGTTETHSTVASAAAAIGITKGSLAVSLTNGKGHASRRLYDKEARAHFHVRVTRVAKGVLQSDDVPS